MKITWGMVSDKPDTEPHEYAFDIELAGAIRTKATCETKAREELARRLDAASANLGAWPDGSPILMEVSLRGRPALFEVDGDEVDEATQVLNAVDQLVVLLRALLDCSDLQLDELEDDTVEAMDNARLHLDTFYPET